MVNAETLKMVRNVAFELCFCQPTKEYILMYTIVARTIEQGDKIS